MHIAALCLQIHALGHYLAIKREEILIHDTTRVNLENTIEAMPFVAHFRILQDTYILKILISLPQPSKSSLFKTNLHSLIFGYSIYLTAFTYIVIHVPCLTLNSVTASIWYHRFYSLVSTIHGSCSKCIEFLIRVLFPRITVFPMLTSTHIYS